MTEDISLRKQIINAEDNKVLFRSDFPQYHEEFVGRVLSSLTEEGVLMRLSPGIYVKPMMSRFGLVEPSVERVVKAIAERDNAQILPVGVVALNALGLSTQVPMVYCFLTSGSARTLMVGKSKVQLKRGVPRNFAYKTKLIALLVQALKALKEENVEEEHLQQIRKLIRMEPDKEALIGDVQRMQGWMKRIVKPMIK